MANVAEAKTNYLKAKKAVVSCQSSIQTLQAKADQLQDSLPQLKREIENAEKAKTAALDNFAMTGNDQNDGENISRWAFRK